MEETRPKVQFVLVHQLLSTGQSQFSSDLCSKTPLTCDNSN